MPYALTDKGVQHLEKSGARKFIDGQIVDLETRVKNEMEGYNQYHPHNLMVLELGCNDAVEAIMGRKDSSERTCEIYNYCYWYNISTKDIRKAMSYYLRDIMIEVLKIPHVDPRTPEGIEKCTRTNPFSFDDSAD